ncbi:hydroxymethylbilane synthase [Lujinxingia vulgaris]|uniref:Porphobilinogen deaminase n=2 Tax=Lujinxingia vulgaris TaxID=2600176 RepID=A0A5C6XBM0_9DELT|nr:hydroxymethylbilane synthase [Lujinxingia vulgaris]
MRTPMNLKLGSRKSALALWQTHHVADLLRAAHPGLTVEIVTMDTLGDLRTDVPLPAIGAKGLFTQELEAALASDAIDLAVHSLKDLPSTLPEGMKFAGSPRRASPLDAFISTRYATFDEVPDGATIATGSQRRKAQLLHRRPNLKFADLRGNIGTRLEKLEREGFDGIIMAHAALERLEMGERVTSALPADQYVPAVGQGAIGLESRIGRDDIDALIAPILDEATMRAVTAERIFMRRLEGGCSVALGAYCEPAETPGQWVFHAWVSSTDGQQCLHESRTGEDPDQLASALVEDFLERGARSILRA